MAAPMRCGSLGGRGGMFLPFLFLLMAALLARGTGNGDEHSAFLRFRELQAQHWQVSRMPAIDRESLAHRLLWVAEKAVWYGALQSAFPGLGMDSPETRWLMSADGAAFALLAAFLAVRHLVRRGYDASRATLAMAAVMVGSAGISFFSGGMIECIMMLAVTVCANLLDTDGALSSAGLAVLGVMAAVLVAAKEYAFPFVMVLALLLVDRRQRAIYLAFVFCATGLLFLAHRAIVGFPVEVAYAGWVVCPPLTFVGRAAELLFSPMFGIVWSVPGVLLIFAAPPTAFRSAAIKGLAVTATSAVVLLVPFWHGAGAAAGQRYIYPFLLILLPEVAGGLGVVIERWRFAPLLVPLAALAFLPAADYRNSLFERYHDGPEVYSHPNPVPGQPKVWMDLPVWDIGLHPAVFAWRTVMAKAAGRKHMQAGFTHGPELDVTMIFPMTGLSRLISQLDGGRFAGRADVVSARRRLTQLGLYRPAAWRVVRILAVLVLLGGLTRLALLECRR